MSGDAEDPSLDTTRLSSADLKNPWVVRSFAAALLAAMHSGLSPRVPRERAELEALTAQALDAFCASLDDDGVLEHAIDAVRAVVRAE